MIFMKRRKTVTHPFYCLKCGRETLNLPRYVSHQYQKGHRKKLWCPWCKTEVNCIEIRNYEELMDFKECFNLSELKNYIYLLLE